MKDINTLKRDFMNDLTELRRLRNEFEEKVKEVRLTKETLEGEVREITKVNDSQERRIKTLELQEKADTLIRAGNYLHAMEYIAVRC